MPQARILNRRGEDRCAAAAEPALRAALRGDCAARVAVYDCGEDRGL
jgi:hypothetical protein